MIMYIIRLNNIIIISGQAEIFGNIKPSRATATAKSVENAQKMDLWNPTAAVAPLPHRKILQKG